ncbi:MAG: NAD kinase [Actinomycetota bacterium]|nr:NAD kinase [Actinomycetota bacterium]MDQ3733909.1 NAD kinase [Actinomycetota bacterium]
MTAQNRAALLVVHTGRADIVELATGVGKALHRDEFEVRVLDGEAEDVIVAGATVVPADERAGTDAEIVIVFGGDGTFLRAAEYARAADVPLIGVNLGRVGFLAETEPDAVDDTIVHILERSYVVEHRLAVEASVFDQHGAKFASTWALNEISVEKASRARVLDVALLVDGRQLTSFGCDGVLCATPTGSTAYAFSAGGPVVWPEVEALLLVPTSAHALFARPLVTPPTSVLTVAVAEYGEGAVLCADGRRTIGVPPGGRVDVVRSQQPVHVARLQSTPFGDRLVARFRLPADGFRHTAAVPDGS